MSSMSESGKASLATLSGAALSLDVKDTSDTRYVQSSALFGKTIDCNLLEFSGSFDDNTV